MDPALAKEVAMLAKARVIGEAIERGDSRVQELYRDATVLISGGTGFMGKQLLEKLFRSCDIKKVFLMMRPKKNKGIHDRLSIMLEDPVFDSVKKSQPGFERKIIPIPADVAELELGMSPADRAMIIDETEVVIHGAATINFDEPLKVAVNTNVRGTVEMLKLGKQCKKLKAFVHISTAFSHSTGRNIGQEVPEKFYDAPLSPQMITDMVATINEERLVNITPELIKTWPNTYAFTKAIAEEACREVGSDLPICVVRPAAVMSSYMEPAPGWLDRSCIFGPCGFVYAVGLGVLHSIHCQLNNVVDNVPVDLVNNAIIAAGWITAQRRSEGDTETKIYTVTSARNSVTWQNMIDIYKGDVIAKYLSNQSVYYVFLYVTRSKLMYLLSSWLWHIIPAYIMDFFSVLLGKQARFVKLCSKMQKHSDVLSFHMNNEWLFRDDNLQNLFSSMNTTDKQIFNCDVATVNMREQLIFTGLGVRKYIIKDDLQDTEKAMTKQFWFRILHYTVVAPLYFYFLFKVGTLVLKLVIFAFTIVRSLFLITC